MAALLVAAYHVWIGRVSGGVDVFFVVTGFFITLTLLAHPARYGRIAPWAYLGRIARRVWPMAAVVLVFAITLTVTLAPASLRGRNYEEILASALYVENWYLALNAIDYLNAADPPTPVQHFWAMSVQGQFYLVWLALAAIALWLSWRDPVKFRRAFATIIIATLVASFTWSVWQTSVRQPFAYFDTASRLWEFSVGGLIALAGSRILLSGMTAAITSWIGLLGLVLCGVILPVAASFPGYVALWPVACAALLLISTRENERKWAATRLLALRPLVWAGAFAFGIYLWHWPLLIGYRYLFGLDAKPGLLAGVVIIGLAIILGWVGHVLLERPISRVRTRSLRLTAGLVSVWVIIVALAGAPAAAYIAGDENASQSPPRSHLECFGASAILDPDACSISGTGADLLPDRTALLRDTGGAYDCYTTADATDLTTCSFGSGDLRVALIGNSHAAMFGPELGRRADALGWTVDVLASNGCLWGAQRPSSPDIAPQCAQRIAAQESLLMGADPYDVVLFAGGRGSTPASEQGIEAIAASWNELRARGTEIIVLEDNPRLTDEAVRCALESSDQELRGGTCDMERDAALAIPDRYISAAGFTESAVVQTLDFYCTQDVCPAVIGDVIVYRDGHHLTATYVSTMADMLVERVLAFVPQDVPTESG